MDVIALQIAHKKEIAVLVLIMTVCVVVETIIMTMVRAPMLILITGVQLWVIIVDMSFQTELVPVPVHRNVSKQVTVADLIVKIVVAIIPQQKQVTVRSGVIIVVIISALMTVLIVAAMMAVVIITNVVQVFKMTVVIVKKNNILENITKNHKLFK